MSVSQGSPFCSARCPTALTFSWICCLHLVHSLQQFFFFSSATILFFGCAHGIQMFPGHGLNSRHSSDNARSLTHSFTRDSPSFSSWSCSSFLSPFKFELAFCALEHLSFGFIEHFSSWIMSLLLNFLRGCPVYLLPPIFILSGFLW